MNDATSPARQCGRCGRALRSAKPYGPVCRARMAAAIAHIGVAYKPGQIAAATQLIDDGGLVVGPGGVCLATSTDGTTVYVVNPTAGTCTCTAGLNGRRCYHLAAATAMVAPTRIAVPVAVAVAA